jgi:hypothetical protein
MLIRKAPARKKKYNGRGGKRAGAGRPPGSKSVAEIKMNAAINKVINAAKKEGQELTAKQACYAVMRAPNVDPAVRLSLAKLLLQYEEPKLASTELSGPGGGPIEHRHSEVLATLKRKLIAPMPANDSGRVAGDADTSGSGGAALPVDDMGATGAIEAGLRRRK